jgi:hypothetical protein
VEKAEFGGKEYGMVSLANLQEGGEMTQLPKAVQEKPSYIFLPSLLGSGKPPDQIWTYKCIEAWKSTLCVSRCFPDGCPHGFMEWVTALVLRDVYAAIRHEINHIDLFYDRGQSQYNNQVEGSVGKLRFIGILRWRRTLLITIGMPILCSPSRGTCCRDICPHCRSERPILCRSEVDGHRSKASCQ